MSVVAEDLAGILKLVALRPEWVAALLLLRVRLCTLQIGRLAAALLAAKPY